MNILAIGDIVGSRACEFVKKQLWGIRKLKDIDFVIANGENAHDSNGISPDIVKDLLYSGVDVITSGNHIWNRKEIISTLDSERNLLRPANYPPQAHGFGYGIYNTPKLRVLVANLQGTVYMDSLASPFETADRILNDNKDKYDIALFDFHAEATSEKKALALYLASRAAVVFGTHTHVQTADEQILPGGTAFITDLGMTGPVNSVIGMKENIALERFLTKVPVRYEVSTGVIRMCGAIFTIDDEKRVAIDVERICIE